MLPLYLKIKTKTKKHTSEYLHPKFESAWNLILGYKCWKKNINIQYLLKQSDNGHWLLAFQMRMICILLLTHRMTRPNLYKWSEQAHNKAVFKQIFCVNSQSTHTVNQWIIDTIGGSGGEGGGGGGRGAGQLCTLSQSANKVVSPFMGSLVQYRETEAGISRMNWASSYIYDKAVLKKNLWE